MKIDVILSADYITDNLVKDKIVVVIDVLRATSVIVTALENGCKEVIPVLTVEEAFELKNKYKNEQCILGGERNAIKIEGFDLSNSPLEYTREMVKDKTVILTTTNGTRAITKCKKADQIFIGSIINAEAIAKEIVKYGKDIVFVNAGTNGQFSIDDFHCTGLIINYLENKHLDLEMTDIAILAKYLINTEKEEKIVDRCKHFKVLEQLGRRVDIEYCFMEKRYSKIHKCRIIEEIIRIN